MQIYSKSMKNATSPLSIQKSQQICTWGGDVYYASRNLLSTCYYYMYSTTWLFTNSGEKKKKKNNIQTK